MASVLKILLAILLGDTVHSDTHTSFRKMCGGLSLRREHCKTWKYNEVTSLCKHSFKTADANRGTHARMMVQQKKAQTPPRGFFMDTGGTLFLVDLLMRKHKVSKRRLKLNPIHYDRDDKILYMTNSFGMIYQGVIGNMGVKVKKYRRFKVKIIDRMTVDTKTNMVAILNFDISKIKCYNASIQIPRKIAEEGCSRGNIGIDKDKRLIYFAQWSKLCSMTYSGNDKKIFKKMKIVNSFHFEFQDEHIFCTTRIRRAIVTYTSDRASGVTQVTRIPLKCPGRKKASLSYVIKVGDLVVAAFDELPGLLVLEGKKCKLIWKRLPVLAIFLSE